MVFQIEQLCRMDIGGLLTHVAELVRSKRTVERKQGAEIIAVVLSSDLCTVEQRRAFEELDDIVLLQQHQYAALGDKMRLKLRDANQLVSNSTPYG
jgi:hypothetical protein